MGRQNAAESVPLIMEPKSAYYKSPLVVLDFQSLYPSIMIAYNYCYSTCLGRVGTFRGQRKFGVLEDLEVPEGLLGSVEDHITSKSEVTGFVDGWTLLLLTEQGCASSRAKRDDVCQANGAEEPLGEDVDGAARYSDHGQTGDEVIERGQSAFTLLPAEGTLLHADAISMLHAGASTSPRRAPTQSQVHLQRDVWVHEREFLWEDACGGDRR